MYHACTRLRLIPSVCPTIYTAESCTALSCGIEVYMHVAMWFVLLESHLSKKRCFYTMSWLNSRWLVPKVIDTNHAWHSRIRKYASCPLVFQLCIATNCWRIVFRWTTQSTWYPALLGSTNSFVCVAIIPVLYKGWTWPICKCDHHAIISPRRVSRSIPRTW